MNVEWSVHSFMCSVERRPKFAKLNYVVVYWFPFTSCEKEGHNNNNNNNSSLTMHQSRWIPRHLFHPPFEVCAFASETSKCFSSLHDLGLLWALKSLICGRRTISWVTPAKHIENKKEQHNSLIECTRSQGRFCSSKGGLNWMGRHLQPNLNCRLGRENSDAWICRQKITRNIQIHQQLL